MTMKKSTGFTLIELIIVISITFVLLAIAVPSFSEAIRQNNLTTTINYFLTGNNIARSEAVTRGKRVSMCKSSNGTSCSILTGENWENGWIIFVNENGGNPAVVDAGEEILKIAPALKSKYTLRGDAAVGSYLTYNPTGDTDTAGTLILCETSNLNYARGVFINTNGRILSAERNNSGVPLNDAGIALTSCTTP